MEGWWGWGRCQILLCDAAKWLTDWLNFHRHTHTHTHTHKKQIYTLANIHISKHKQTHTCTCLQLSEFFSLHCSSSPLSLPPSLSPLHSPCSFCVCPNRSKTWVHCPHGSRWSDQIHPPSPPLPQTQAALITRAPAATFMLRITPYRMIINVWKWLLCSSQSVSPSAKRVLCTVLTAWTGTVDTFWLTWNKFMWTNISEEVIFSLGLVSRENCTISTYRLAGKRLKRSLSSIQFTYSFHTIQKSLLLTSDAHNLEGLNLEHLSWGQLAVVFHLQLLKVAHIATLQHKSSHVCITCCFVDVAVSFSLQLRVMGKVYVTSHSLPTHFFYFFF